MEFRLARLDELEQLAKMRWEMWLEDGADAAQQERAEFLADFAGWLEPKLSSEWFVWCAIDSGSIVAHMYIQRINKLPKPSAPLDAFGYVTSVYTRPAYRNQGTGARLLEFVEAWALETDFEFLVLWPSEKSVPFWTRANFLQNDSLLREVRPYVN